MMSEMNSTVNPGYDKYRNHPAIANSDLKYLHSPRVFKARKEKIYEEEKKDYEVFGSLVDSFILDSREKFDQKYFLVPDIETPSSPNQQKFVDLIVQEEETPDANRIGELYIQCYKVSAAKIKSGAHLEEALELKRKLQDFLNIQEELKTRTGYTQAQLDILLRIEQNLRAHEFASFLLWEEKMFVIRKKHFLMINHEWLGVDWKGEADLVVVDTHEKIIYNVEVKTTSKYLSNFGYEYKKYKYYRQQALYRKLALKELVKIGVIENPEEYLVRTSCIAIESNSQFNEVAVIPIPEPVLQKGEEELKEAAELIKYYREHGWEYTRSYKENDGLELVSWDDVFN